MFASSGFPVDTYWDVEHAHHPAGVDGSGFGVWTPEILGQYKSIVIWTDFSPTAPAFEALMDAYVQAGGNILLTTYAWGNFTQAFRSGALGVFNIQGSFSGLHVGADNTWNRNLIWAPRILTDLAGLSFANNGG